MNVKNPLKYWIWYDNLNRQERIKAYIVNLTIWIMLITWFAAMIGFLIAILHGN